MKRSHRAVAWAAGFAVFVLLLIVLRGVLLPFVLGMTIAYFLDPVANWLKARGLSRALAAAIILLAFFLAAGLALVAIVPPLQKQLVALVGAVPEMLDLLRSRLQPFVENVWEGLSEEQVAELRDAAGGYAASAVKWFGDLLGGIWSGGVALLDVLSLAIVTPVVAFYMLRDWPDIVAHIDALVPQKSVASVRQLATEIDRVLASFIRGQATVCLILGVIYAVGLGAIGLKFGLLIGLGAGLASFIPYVGAGTGLLLGLGVASLQFDAWTPVALVGAVFAVGQVLESYLLTPKLIGDSIGLHPVWLLFALMAGGSLLGFTGILVAVPVAAALGVLVRYWIGEYRGSDLYIDTPGSGANDR